MALWFSVTFERCSFIITLKIKLHLSWCFWTSSLVKLKKDGYFTRWNDLNNAFIIQHIHDVVLRIFTDLQMFFYIIYPLKWGIKWKCSLIVIYSLFFYEWSYLQRCFEVAPKVAEINFENGKVVLMLSNVVQINVEICSVDFKLFNVANFNVDIYNAVSTLILRCPTLQYHTSLTPTLKQCWNVCFGEMS